KLGPQTELYLGLIHHNDAAGDAARLTAARRHGRVDGIGTECGMARGDPARLPALLAAHARAAELAVWEKTGLSVRMAKNLKRAGSKLKCAVVLRLGVVERYDQQPFEKAAHCTQCAAHDAERCPVRAR